MHGGTRLCASLAVPWPSDGTRLRLGLALQFADVSGSILIMNHFPQNLFLASLKHRRTKDRQSSEMTAQAIEARVLRAANSSSIGAMANT